jgi:C-terminal processing protease CtpA/Prc
VLSVDGISVTELGVDGAVAHIRGTAGTSVVLDVRHGDQVATMSVERRKLKA